MFTNFDLGAPLGLLSSARAASLADEAPFNVPNERPASPFPAFLKSEWKVTVSQCKQHESMVSCRQGEGVVHFPLMVFERGSACHI